MMRGLLPWLLGALLLSPGALLGAGDYTFDSTNNGNHDVDEFGTNAAHRISTDKTFMCWVNSSVTLTTQNYLARDTNATTDRDMQLRTKSSDDLMRSEASSGGTAAAGWSVDSTTDIVDGTWHHTAVRVDMTTQVDPYVDGVDEGTDSTVATPDDPANGIKLGGADTSVHTGDHQGLVGDCRMYDFAMDTDEIETIHAAQGRDKIYGGLVFRTTWMNDAPGTGGSGTLHDISPTNVSMTRRGNSDTAESVLMGLK